MNDIEAIGQLTARCAQAGDAGDLAAWLECFAPDGSFERPDLGRAWRGHEELTSLFGGYGVSGRHLTTGPVIDVDADTARSSCYLLFLDASRAFQPHMVGVYHDDVVRRDGQWRFQRRQLLVDFVAAE